MNFLIEELLSYLYPRTLGFIRSLNRQMIYFISVRQDFMIHSPNDITAISLTLDFNISLIENNLLQWIVLIQKHSVRFGGFTGVYSAPNPFCFWYTCWSLINIQIKIYKINKNLYKDLKELSFWLNAHKI